MSRARTSILVARFSFRASALASAIARSAQAHVGHGASLKQTMPRFVMRFGSRYEHLIMRTIDFLTMRDWIYANPTLKRGIDWLSDKVMVLANGEVLSLEEALEMVASVDASGYTIAAGTCPCRRARNVISDTVPNNTDVVFGRWADTYLSTYPGLYTKVDGAEAGRLIEDFDRHGFVHQVYGFNRKEGAAYVMCNCDQSVCIPLLAQKKRGFEAFRRGRSVAVVDSAACLGVEDCGICIERCPFEARSTGEGGKSAPDEARCFGCGVCRITCRGKATRLERKKGAKLLYARAFVGD